MVSTMRALPLSPQSRLQHSPNAKYALLVVVEDEDSRRLRHVDAWDQRERGGRQNAHYSLSSRTRTAAVCDMSLLMHEIDGSEVEDKTHTARCRRGRGRCLMNEIDGSEREDNPAHVKRTRRISLAAPTKLHMRALRCPGAANSYEYVVERSPLIISRELCPKNTL